MRPATGDFYKTLGLPRASRKLYRLLRGPYGVRELAEQMDVDPDTIYQWEHGVCQPSPPLLRQLVDHYLMVARKYGRDPLHLITAKPRPAVPSAAPRRPAHQAKSTPVTPAAALTTAAETGGGAAPQPSAPPLLPHVGGAEKNSVNQ